MGRTIVDLSIAIDGNPHNDPEGMAATIQRFAHRETAAQIAAFFPGLEASDLPDGEGWAVELLTVSTHHGTHMDAPWHYHSTTDNGARPAPGIDDTPLEYCFQPGVKLDFRGLPDGYVVTPQDLEREFDRIGYALRPLDIVLVNTRAGALSGQPGFVQAGCGMGRDATLHLLDKGVKVVGTDAWSWDAPFSFTRARWERDRDPSVIWEGHKAGRVAPYWQMEKLANLERLPPFGFQVCCFPVKIAGASAGWTRAVAIIEDAQGPGA